MKYAWVGRTPVGEAGHTRAAVGGSLVVVVHILAVGADRTPVGADHNPVGAGGTLVGADKGEVFPKTKYSINQHRTYSRFDMKILFSFFLCIKWFTRVF